MAQKRFHRLVAVSWPSWIRYDQYLINSNPCMRDFSCKRKLKYVHWFLRYQGHSQKFSACAQSRIFGRSQWPGGPTWGCIWLHASTKIQGKGYVFGPILSTPWKFLAKALQDTNIYASSPLDRGIIIIHCRAIICSLLLFTTRFSIEHGQILAPKIKKISLTLLFSLLKLHNTIRNECFYADLNA